MKLYYVLLTILLISCNRFHTERNKIFGGQEKKAIVNGDQERQQGIQKQHQAGYIASDEVESGEKSVGLLLTSVNLFWKRYRAFEKTLMTALNLEKQEICQELGEYSCIDNVGLTHLGGNDIIKGQLSYAAKPTSLTPIVVDRIVLTACIRRVEKDKQAGLKAATLFKNYNFQATAVDRTKVEEIADQLYQRFLTRNADPQELNSITNFSLGKSAEEIAISLCFAVGSQIENIFL